MVVSSAKNAALWEGIKNNYTCKVSKLERQENKLRYKVQALERIADSGPDPCLCDNQKAKSPQLDFQDFPLPNLNLNIAELDTCPCKPCKYKAKFNTNTCGCTEKSDDECHCVEKPPKENKCDCEEKKLNELLEKIYISAPEILAKDIKVPPPERKKANSDDCSCDIEKALKSKILPIIDEMLDNFCDACDDVNNVFSPLHSKHNCSCFNMLDLSPSSCACKSESAGKRGKHPKNCECDLCVCDPCKACDDVSSRTHSASCDCEACVCDPCVPGSKADSPKGGTKHGQTCECLECVCDPCNIISNQGLKSSQSGRKGCQCGDSAHRYAPTRTAPKESGVRRDTRTKKGCPCKGSFENGPRGASSNWLATAPKASPKPGPNCICLQCVCDPCGSDTKQGGGGSKAGNPGCKCPDGKLLTGTASRPSRTIREQPKIKDKCVCDSQAGKQSKLRGAHAPDCDCKSCVCDPCSTAGQSSKGADNNIPDCDCEICSCDPCGNDPPPSTKQQQKHGPDCDCNSCVCDPCGPSNTEPCACAECVCEVCKRKMPSGGKGKHTVDCGCDPCIFDVKSKPQRNSFVGCGPAPATKTGSKIPVAKGCICRDPCPCDPCFFDNDAMEALTRSVLGDDCDCHTKGKKAAVRTKLTNARKQISSNMSIKSVDIGHMKEIIQMYNIQKKLRKRIEDLEDKQRNLTTGRCR